MPQKNSRTETSDVTPTDIARRSGMTKGAVYFHFATKEQVGSLYPTSSTISCVC